MNRPNGKYNPNDHTQPPRNDIVFAVLSRAETEPTLEAGEPFHVPRGTPVYHTLEAAQEYATAIMARYIDVYAVFGIVWGIDTEPDTGAAHVRWHRLKHSGEVHAVDTSHVFDAWKADLYPRNVDRRMD